MTRDPLASLHLGLSAEAMVLIDPQRGEHWPSSGHGRSLMLPAILSVTLMTLLPGLHIDRGGGWRQLARGWNAAIAATSPQ